MDNASDEVGKLADEFLGKLDGSPGFTLGDGSRRAVDGLMAFLADPVESVQFWLERWIEGCPEKANHGLVAIRTSGPVSFGVHERQTSLESGVVSHDQGPIQVNVHQFLSRLYIPAGDLQEVFDLCLGNPVGLC